ncbi:MAG: ribonucleoside-diphosphate reductase subunit alpha [Thermomicrobiales bacterium]
MSLTSLSPSANGSRALPAVHKRDGSTAAFDGERIRVAIEKAFRAELDLSADIPLAPETAAKIASLATEVVVWCHANDEVRVEQIQDEVEKVLMRAGDHGVARRYILYREARAEERRARVIHYTRADGSAAELDPDALRQRIAEACAGLGDDLAAPVFAEALGSLYNGITEPEIAQALILAARARFEREPAYTYVAARLLLTTLYAEAFGVETLLSQATDAYRGYVPRYIETGIAAEMLDPALATFDLDRIAAALRPERDLAFNYLGLQTLYDRYLLQTKGCRYESPQLFWMRVAMGLALNEDDREGRAIAFYDLISQFAFVPSSPTLFNAGTRHPQLSSCFLTTVPDDLGTIFKCVRDNALLSKWSGGLGNDWTNVRALGAHIKGTNGNSQGIIPFLKVANDTAIAVNQCFAPETRVYTNDGTKTIADVRDGDLVLGIDGEYRAVTETFAYMQRDAMTEITLKHAPEPLRVTRGHPLYALRGVPLEQASRRTYSGLRTDRLSPKWVDAGELRKGDYVAQVIPVEVVPVAGFTADDAFLYGLMLGDGHCTSNDYEWGIMLHSETDAETLAFVRGYLSERGIPFHEAKHHDGVATQIKWSTWRTNGDLQLPFNSDDLYNAAREKRIAPRLAHLPRPLAAQVIRGIIEADGYISRGTEITISTHSRELMESVRYQMLRLGVPIAARYRERERAESKFAGTTREWVIPIPAVPDIAELVGCVPLAKHNWITYGGHVFTRVKEVRPIGPCATVHDLKVEGVESYMTTAGLAHNGGKRKGAVCAYLEPWHLDIEEFLELRRNTGDERRRTHDMNTALWIPDLFMQRVAEGGDWTLFSPSDVPDLHDLSGHAFVERYTAYEAMARNGQITLSRTLPAVDLWRKMLTMLFETGHPWITFKDPSNIRSSQDHAGVVHSSNLCTEILLNTAADETAVCNLGSINLPVHLTDGKVDTTRLKATVRTAVRMLDNVIDLTYYPTDEARAANLRHRPVGLGIMGFQDALYALGVSYASEEAIEFADRSMEVISYFAILASTELAHERGAYPSYAGSKWDRGILPIDSIGLLEAARGLPVEMDRTMTMPWEKVRNAAWQYGMRNSNVMAIAPTATISNIVGTSQSIEPAYKNLFVKSNMSGDFTQINTALVADLKRLGLWDDAMLDDLKYYDGSLLDIERIPDAIKQRYLTAFEVDPSWLIEAASRRQKWIDMGQSLNLYMVEPSGRKLSEMYFAAWNKGLKTTYYLRTLAATQVEKSTLDINRRAIQPRWMKNQSASSNIQITRPATEVDDATACTLGEDCEACQ